METVKRNLLMQMKDAITGHVHHVSSRSHCQVRRSRGSPWDSLLWSFNWIVKCVGYPDTTTRSAESWNSHNFDSLINYVMSNLSRSYDADVMFVDDSLRLIIRKTALEECELEFTERLVRLLQWRRTFNATTTVDSHVMMIDTLLGLSIETTPGRFRSWHLGWKYLRDHLICWMKWYVILAKGPHLGTITSRWKTNILQILFSSSVSRWHWRKSRITYLRSSKKEKIWHIFTTTNWMEAKQSRKDVRV